MIVRNNINTRHLYLGNKQIHYAYLGNTLVYNPYVMLDPEENVRLDTAGTPKKLLVISSNDKWKISI